MGWTGVQYSMWRVGLAIAVASTCLARLEHASGPAWALLAIGVPSAVAFAGGWRDRALAFHLLALLLIVGAPIDGAPLVLPGSDLILTSLLLVLHLFTPITPFGAWDARERVDPRGDWRRPAALGHVAWVLLVVVQLDITLAHFDASLLGGGGRAGFPGADSILALPRAALVVALGLATAVPAWRAPVWIAITLLEIARLAATGPVEGDGALFLLHFIAADPGWWPGRTLHPVGDIDDSSRETARLYYDGDCGFCHRSVRIVLSEEANTPPALALRFAPLQGETFAGWAAGRDDVDPETLPDSIVLVCEDGRVLTRSAAAAEIASRLGGAWRGLGLLASWLPSAPLDALYDGIARIRTRLFPAPKDACPILPPDLRARFDP